MEEDAINEGVVANGKPKAIRWYNNRTFPLVPMLEIKKANKHNTSGFTFKWLFFTVWTLDNLSFELAIVADTHWGVGLVGLLLYLRWVIAIPCPYKLDVWISRNFSRNRNINKLN